MARIAIPVVGIIVGLLVLIFVGVGLFSWDAPDVNEIGLHYSGGPLEGQHFEGVVDPGAHGRFMGFQDKLVKLPANQRTYIISRTAGEGDRGGGDFISAKNSEGVEVDYETSVWFVLNDNPKVLRDFYENICTKYDDCHDDPATNDDGWGLMLNDYLRKVEETALQDESRRSTTDDLVKNADALTDIQASVASVLQEKVNDNLGGPYFTDIRFQINDVDVPDEVSEGYNKVKAAELITQTKKQEVLQAEQQNLAAEKLQATLNNNPNYLKLKQTEALQEAVEKGGVEFWVLPNDMTLNAPSPH